MNARRRTGASRVRKEFSRRGDPLSRYRGIHSIDVSAAGIDAYEGFGDDFDNASGVGGVEPEMHVEPAVIVSGFLALVDMWLALAIAP